MKTKSCLSGAGVFGALAGLIRLAQYIFTIGKDGYYTPSLLSSVLNYALIALLALGTAWILFCGFGGKKREIAFAPLFRRSAYASLCFWALGVIALADGGMRLWTAETRLARLVGIACLLGGLGWIFLERFSFRGKTVGIIAAFPALHLGAVVLDYFWATHKYIHVSEYALVILSISAMMFFNFTVHKPASGGGSTGQRICATAGLTILMTASSLLPLLPAFYLQGMQKEVLWTNGVLFLIGFFQLILACITLKHLSTLPPEQPKEEPSGPDLSALEEYISDLPEVEEEEE